MDHRQVLRFIAAGRIAIGVAALVAPRRLVSGWLGSTAAHGSVTLLTRAFGAREVAVGAGTLWALDAGGPVRPWVAAGIACDGIDAASSVLAIGHLGAAKALLNGAVALGATAAGVAALDAVD